MTHFKIIATVHRKERHQTKEITTKYISVLALLRCANEMVMLPTGAKGKQLFHFHQMTPQGRQLPRIRNH